MQSWNRKRGHHCQGKEDADNLLKETNREIEKTIRHIKENKAEKKETLKVRKNLESLTKKVGEVSKKKDKAIEELKVDDRVRILGQEGTGVILDVQGKNAIVQFGLMKSVIKLDKLEKATGAVEKEIVSRLRSVGINVHEKRTNFNSTLDIRGKRVDEVISILDQFMDTAILLGQGS
jgi:DNA mismatch repair protein MutS2